MRGPGNTRSIWNAELIMDRVAHALQLDPAEVRAKNFYTHAAQLTPYKNPLFQCNMQAVWAQLRARVDYERLRAEAARFNAAHAFKKRGVSLSTVKYGITFHGPDNHHGAALSVYAEDGSISVTHSGAEMGQGINTKVKTKRRSLRTACRRSALHLYQLEARPLISLLLRANLFVCTTARVPCVCAQVLATVVYKLNDFLSAEGAAYRVTMSDCAIGDCNSRAIANAGLTGGSSGSETCCLTASYACDELAKRLRPVVRAHPDCQSWGELIARADEQQVHLQVLQEHYTADPTPAFQYFVYAAACAQVELDMLTGAHEVRSVDIVYDCGHSLNPIVDMGQLYGGRTNNSSCLQLSRHLPGLSSTRALTTVVF